MQDTKYYCPLDGSNLTIIPGGVWRCSVCSKLHPDRNPYFSEEFLKGFVAGYGRAIKHVETKVLKMHKFIRADYNFKDHDITYKNGGQNGSST
jgi:hypothetical protein